MHLKMMQAKDAAEKKRMAEEERKMNIQALEFKRAKELAHLHAEQAEADAKHEAKMRLMQEKHELALQKHEAEQMAREHAERMKTEA